MNSELLLQETDNKSFIILWVSQICAFYTFVRIFKLWIFKYDDNDDLSLVAYHVFCENAAYEN